MPLSISLNRFQADIAQCDQLMANAHASDANGSPILPAADRRQITIAALLNAYISWETFLESSLVAFMMGEPTLGGTPPIKYVAPPTEPAALEMITGTQRYFDFGNPDYVRKIVRVFFKDGYPYEPPLSSITSEWADIRTMRNASAHMTSTTQKALDALALRIFSSPAAGVDLYQLLTSPDPRSTTGETVVVAYENKLVSAAQLIAQG